MTISTTEASAKLRLIDTGRKIGRQNIAIDQALIEGHRRGTTPDTLRLLEFSPSALVGRHQDLSRELDLDYCQQHNIDVGRRVTGGGAIYLDPGQLGWELICHRRRFNGGGLEQVAATICRAAAAALSEFGLKARYRPRNDIEIAGKKISGTGGFFDADTLFYQGTLLLELDRRAMFKVLKVEPQKWLKHGASAAARVTSLADAGFVSTTPRELFRRDFAERLANQLGFELAAGELSRVEVAAAQQVFNEDIGNDEFVRDIDKVASVGHWGTAERLTRGGQLRAAVRYRATGDRIQHVIISGDYFVTPPRIIYDLECRLKDCPASHLADVINRFMAEQDVGLMSFSCDDLIAVIEVAASAHRSSRGDG